MRCYILGPMRNKRDFNYPAFMKAAADLRKAGWKVFNPAEFDILQGEVNVGMTIPAQKRMMARPEQARKYAERDIAAILRLRAEDGDAVVALPGWKQSSGASAEVAVARWVHLPVYTVKEAINVARESRRP